MEKDGVFNSYVEELESRNGTEYFHGDTIEPTVVATRMFNAIEEAQYPADWLKHNNALKIACKKHGITKSKELRELVKNG